MLRQRFKKSYKVVKELNAFPKIPEAYVETSTIGGTVTVLSWFLIAWLIIMETNYWLDTRVHFKFEPDTDLEAKLTINIDVTIAMICPYLTIDVVDPTNQDMSKFGTVEKEDTVWDHGPENRRLFESIKYMNAYLREEFHSLQHLLWKSGGTPILRTKSQSASSHSSSNYDACRIYGTLTLNKVAGSIHILPGTTMTLEVPNGHIQISGLLPANELNFTHRITQFSFGDPSFNIIQPLEGDEKITDQIPTDVDTFFSKTQTYQYSVRDSERPIDHFKGSHGMSGLFFKYDMSALKVRVIQERDTLLQFFLRISSIVCGVYVCTGVLNGALRRISDLFLNKNKERTKERKPILLRPAGLAGAPIPHSAPVKSPLTSPAGFQSAVPYTRLE